MLTEFDFLDAIRLNNIFRVKQYIAENFNNQDAFNVVSPTGRSALHFAVLTRSLEMVALLLSAPGIELNFADKNDNTALSNAKRSNLKEIENILIEAGANDVLKKNLVILYTDIKWNYQRKLRFHQILSL
ncbi:MAG: ankyrin repeat domain-containing protein [Legionella sp.]|uniref:ankyrin repeat domain-containing protein n=1 Tax=Legionella sp. TaxID=459 RepID=UPI00284EB5D2|nr:ankyrin repeat domain-containing protein [Legionella sp.]